MQLTKVATSRDGIGFVGCPEVLARPHLRAFAHGGMTYALAMPGVPGAGESGIAVAEIDWG